MAQNDNPIIFIEDLQRLPLRPRRPALPGSVSVYRSRNGRLRMPNGGYTAGELLLRGPREVYEIDVARHTSQLTCDLTHAHSSTPISLEIDFAWQVTDPIAVVSSRLTDAYELCWTNLHAYLQKILDEMDASTAADAVSALRRAVPFHIDLPEGVRLTVRRAAQSNEAATGWPMTLTGIAGGSSEILEVWLGYYELAHRARRALEEQAARRDEDAADGIAVTAGEPAGEFEDLMADVVDTFTDLVEHIGRELPEPGADAGP